RGIANEIPSAEGPRALLKVRLRQHAPEESAFRRFFRSWNSRLVRQLAPFPAALAIFGLIWFTASPGEGAAIPRADLTPGAVLNVAVTDVCRNRLSGNREVIPAVQRRVFAEYRMPEADARRYEVDYLITPALGGSDDIRNLWPQPYSGST